MKTLAMRLTEENLKIMTEWCNANGIEYDILGDNKSMAMPKIKPQVSTPQPRTYEPQSNDIVVEITRKDNAVFVPFTSKASNAVINAQLREYGFVWDKDYVLDDTYKKDYARNGVTHKAGEHKTGAWVLMKGSKRDIVGCEKFVAEHPTLVASADAINAQRTKWAERSARKAARA